MIRLDPRVRAYGKAAYACLWLVALAATIAILTAASAGCGAAGRVSTATACATVIAALGEAQHLEPERALADIESQSSICRRLAPDAGTP